MVKRVILVNSKSWRVVLLGLVLCSWGIHGSDGVAAPGMPTPSVATSGVATPTGRVRQSTRAPLQSTSPLRSRPAARHKPRLVARRKPQQKLYDIRVKSHATYTRIVLVLTANVGGINHDAIPAKKRIPPRIYVDLTPCAPMRKWSRTPLWIGDAHVGRIRVARNTRRTTRVVFELKRAAGYRVTILQRPMRVVVDVARKGLPAKFTAKSRLPLERPRPWRSRHRRNPWRRQLPTRSKHALRHRGPLPKIPFPLVIRKIAIDPGHGGPEDGAVGRRTGLREKDITLDIARRVVKKLRRRTRVKITLLRRSDRQVSLSARASLAQRRKADLLVSIHINAHTNRKVSGISTYILDWNSRSFAARLLSSDPLTARENQGVHPKRFAGGAVNTIIAGLKRNSNLIASRIMAIAVQQSMVRRVKKFYPSVRDLGVRKGLFYLLFAAQMPGILVEASYLSNPKEERLLRTSRYREQLALGISTGLLRFIRHAKKPKKRR